MATSFYINASNYSSKQRMKRLRTLNHILPNMIHLPFGNCSLFKSKITCNLSVMAVTIFTSCQFEFRGYDTIDCQCQTVAHVAPYWVYTGIVNILHRYIQFHSHANFWCNKTPLHTNHLDHIGLVG